MFDGTYPSERTSWRKQVLRGALTRESDIVKNVWQMKQFQVFRSSWSRSKFLHDVSLMVGSASDKIRHTILGQECKWRCSEHIISTETDGTIQWH